MGGVGAFVVVVVVAVLLYRHRAEEADSDYHPAQATKASPANDESAEPAFDWIRVECRCELAANDRCDQTLRVRAKLRANCPGQRLVRWPLPAGASVKIRNIRALSAGHMVVAGPSTAQHSCLIDLGRDLTVDEETEVRIEVRARDDEGLTGSRVRLPVLESVTVLLILVVFPNSLIPRRYYGHEYAAGEDSSAASLQPKREASGALQLEVANARSGADYEISWSY